MHIWPEFWQIAHGEMIPNRQGSADGFPSGFLDVSYHLYKNMTPVSIGMWARQFEVKIDPSETIRFPTRSPYFPLMYIPHALVMRLVLLLSRAPAAIHYYLARLACLALYAGLTFAAIRSLPSWEVVAHRSRPLPHGDYPGLNGNA